MMYERTVRAIFHRLVCLCLKQQEGSGSRTVYRRRIVCYCVSILHTISRLRHSTWCGEGVSGRGNSNSALVDRQAASRAVAPSPAARVSFAHCAQSRALPVPVSC